MYKGLLVQAEAKKVYGIHFVDEAAPPVALVQFATENLKSEDPMQWTGIMNNCRAQAEEIIRAELIYT